MVHKRYTAPANTRETSCASKSFGPVHSAVYNITTSDRYTTRYREPPTCNRDIEAGLIDAVIAPLGQYLAAVIVQRSIQIVLEGKGHNKGNIKTVLTPPPATLRLLPFCCGRRRFRFIRAPLNTRVRAS